MCVHRLVALVPNMPQMEKTRCVCLCLCLCLFLYLHLPLPLPLPSSSSYPSRAVFPPPPLWCIPIVIAIASPPAYRHAQRVFAQDSHVFWTGKVQCLFGSFVGWPGLFCMANLPNKSNQSKQAVQLCFWEFNITDSAEMYISATLRK